MSVIDLETIQSIVRHDGNLFVPEAITEAIGSCISSSYSDVLLEIERLKSVYANYAKLDEAIVVDYHGQVTIDAYSANYLPRNTLIPKILFLSTVEHPAFREIPGEVRILDLGSGTGGIGLGFLDLFQKEPFRHAHVKIACCDASKPSLNRQTQLLQKLKFTNCEVWHSIVDFAKQENYKSSLLKFAPYDFVITANLLTELPREHIDTLLLSVTDILAPKGLLLIAEAPRLYTTKLTAHASQLLNGAGLHRFYPCPPEHKCSNDQCWVWLETDFECPEVKIGTGLITVANILKTTWVLFCRSKYSVYDFLGEEHPDLKWGCGTPFGSEFDVREKMDYQVCTPDGVRTATHARAKALFRDKKGVILRGSIIGFTNGYSKARICWHPLY